MQRRIVHFITQTGEAASRCCDVTGVGAQYRPARWRPASDVVSAGCSEGITLPVRIVSPRLSVRTSSTLLVLYGDQRQLERFWVTANSRVENQRDQCAKTRRQSINQCEYFASASSYTMPRWNAEFQRSQRQVQVMPGTSTTLSAQVWCHQNVVTGDGSSS